MTRPEEIKAQYIQSVNRHLDDLVHNRSVDMLEIEDFARMLCIHPTHLSNTIQATTGTSACGVFQVKILEKALELLADSSLSIQQIARQLTYEPSQFSKWFRRMTGLTPKAYRAQLSAPGKRNINTEIMTSLENRLGIPLCF